MFTTIQNIGVQILASYVPNQKHLWIFKLKLTHRLSHYPIDFIFWINKFTLNDPYKVFLGQHALIQADSYRLEFLLLVLSFEGFVVFEV